MSKRRKKQQTPEVQQIPGTPRSRFLRYCLIGVLSGAVVLVWVALLSFSPTDPPSTLMHPPKDPVDNAAGLVGAYLAYALRYWLGGGVYMGLLFASIAAVILMLGGRIGELPWRLIGLVLLIASTSAAVYLLDPAQADGAFSGSAGILGAALGGFLLSRFSLAAWVIVLVAFGVGLMLTADNLVMKIPSLGKKAWQKRSDLQALKDALAARRAEQAVTAPMAVTAAPRPAAAAPSSKQPRAKASAQVPPAGAIFASPAKPPAAKPKPRKEQQRRDRGGQAGGEEFELPSLDLLAEPSGGYIESQEAMAAEKREILQQTLTNFGVDARVLGHMTGPVITMFELSLAPGVKVSQVGNLANDIARALAVPGVRIVSPLPGRDTIGIEVPNLEKEIVRLKELMNMAPEAPERMRLPLYLGKDAGGHAIVADLAAMPHLLIAGTTGSGKSVCINSIIAAILMTRTPQQARLILVDPKMVEMAAFENIPHLLCPIINDMRRAENILEWAATKMDERYELFREVGVRNIDGFNRLGAEEIYSRLKAETPEERARIPERLASYVIIIDELADLIMTSSREVENHIIRIAQKARAVGIHLILATQRPSVNVVTGLIKSNMPCRISFRVASRQESRIVLDQNGADVLLGQGDMLFLQPGTSNLIRAQGTFVDDGEVRALVQAVSKSGRQEFNSELLRLNSAPLGDSPVERDEMFDQAVEIVLASQRGSVSLLQRRLQIGYSRASRIIDQMADAGILGEYKGSQARECMMTLEDWHSLKESAAADQSGRSAANGQPTSV